MIRPETGVFAWTTGNGGVHHYRQAEPLRVARDLGIKTGSGPAIDDAIAEQFDTIQVHMLWDERCSEGWRKLARGGDHRLVFDVDDAMWTPDFQPFRQHYTGDVLNRVYENMRLAHVVTTPSVAIAEHLTTVVGCKNVHVCPNTVPERLLHLAGIPRPYPDLPRPSSAIGTNFVVGYQGSPSHANDFPPRILAQLLRFLDRAPAWTLHFWGPEEIPAGWPADRVGHTPWKERVWDYYASLSMDVGIGPLKASTFNRCKSSLRAVEYAALGIPAVVSNLTPYTDTGTPDGVGLVEDGVTGLLLETWQRWDDALCMLADPGNATWRMDMGLEARRRAERWTTEAGIGRWVDAWNSV